MILTPWTPNYIDLIASDIAGAEEWRDANVSDRAIYRAYALLALVKGTEATCRDVHDAWSSAVSAEMYGKRGHPDLVPYSELTTESQAKNHEYMLAIHTVAHRRTDDPHD